MKLNSVKMTPYLYILPFFILFLIFGVYPIVYSAFISFYKWGNTGAVEFLGLRNYSRFFGSERDPLFWISLKNTLILLVTGSLLQQLYNPTGSGPLNYIVNSMGFSLFPIQQSGGR